MLKRSLSLAAAHKTTVETALKEARHEVVDSQSGEGRRKNDGAVLIVYIAVKSITKGTKGGLNRDIKPAIDALREKHPELPGVIASPIIRKDARRPN